MNIKYEENEKKMVFLHTLTYNTDKYMKNGSF